MDGEEYHAGGIEIYAYIVEQGGRPGVDFSCEPVVKDRELPAGVAEYNQVIEEFCRETVTRFPDPQTVGRFYHEVKKDGARSRCWYRIVVRARIDSEGKIVTQISDLIDPGLVKADPHVRFRARQLRGMLQRGLRSEGTGYPEPGK